MNDEELRNKMRDETVETLLDILEEVRNEPSIISKFNLKRDVKPVFRQGRAVPAQWLEKSNSREILIEKPNASVRIEITEY